MLSQARTEIDQQFAAAGNIGIVAGAGRLPEELAERLTARGLTPHVAALVGAASPALERYSHTWVAFFQLGKLLRFLRGNGCREICIVGSVRRPDLSGIRLDWEGLRAIATILRMTISGGDDSVLTQFIRLFERRGFIVRGAHELAPELVAGGGTLGQIAPSPADQRDVVRGWQVIQALGPFDVGQAAVVVRGHVIALEAVEGTDAMLERAAKHQQWGRKPGRDRAGALVKRPKPGQELRIDMPTIGPQTVARAADAGLAGIAVAGGAVLIVDRVTTVAEADRRGLFICGISEAEAQGQ